MLYNRGTPSNGAVRQGKIMIDKLVDGYMPETCDLFQNEIERIKERLVYLEELEEAIREMSQVMETFKDEHQ